MDLLTDCYLLDKSGNRKSATEALKDTTVLAFYFSAHSCPTCRQFTPVLARAFSESRSSDPGSLVQVIFVSSDRSKEEMEKYMRESHGDWLAVPHGDTVISRLSARFGVGRWSIPALKVVTKDGREICQEGGREVVDRGAAVFNEWGAMGGHISVDLSSVELLRDNEESVKVTAKDILERLLRNVVSHPEEDKYRQVKLSNKTIEEKLLPANGAFEILFSIGFEEAEDRLLLPKSVPLNRIRKFLQAINNLNNSTESAPPSSSLVTPQATPQITPQSPALATPPALSLASTSSLVMSGVSDNETEFKRRLVDGLAHMDSYESSAAQAAALHSMPVSTFEAAATDKLVNARKRGEKIKEGIYRDLLLLEFKEWFKTDFFSWVDSPECTACGGVTEGCGNVPPTPQEQADGAGRVEGYRCKTGCTHTVRFPRYHGKPEKLLETRKGRCGEWANCFVLCCRALGFDTRYVLDWTDHVWAEVWSEAEGRWLHVDPGETVDKTLVYEAGWGKKLTYVIAFSKDEVQDVTWRYSMNHSATKSRRQLVRPRWLIQNILTLTATRQTRLTEAEREQLAKRRLAECLEMLTARTVGEGDKVGRQTGSLAWRMARGELGGAQGSSGHIFRPTPTEQKEGVMVVEYNCMEDRYYRGSARELAWISSEEKGGKVGFQNGVHSFTNIARKVEADWNKVYLARTEGETGKGSITWKLSLKEVPGLTVGKVELMVGSTQYHSGKVVWKLCGDSTCLLPQSGVLLQTDQMTGSSELTLTADLLGGDGEMAWQHSQLFRTSRDGSGERGPQLVMKVILRKS